MQLTAREAHEKGLLKPGVKFSFNDSKYLIMRRYNKTGWDCTKNLELPKGEWEEKKEDFYLSICSTGEDRNKEIEIIEPLDIPTVTELFDKLRKRKDATISAVNLQLASRYFYNPFKLNEYQEHLQKAFNAYKRPNLIKKSMSKVTKFISRLSLSADDKLLLDAELEDPSGVPTDAGYEASHLISYKENREKLIEYAKEMKKQEKEDKK